MPPGIFIDIHRHGKGEGRVIVNFDTSEWTGKEHWDGYYSLGIHPWFIGRQDCRAALQTLESALADANLLALGECGLDRLVGAPFSEQESIFIAQLELAEQCGKPVVIHCVRAFNELLRIKSKRKSSVPWIVHGFNNKPSIAAWLVDRGCYLSFGKALLHPNSNAAKVLPAVPGDRTFLETDDSGLGIDSIYRAAAAILQIDLPELQQHLENNFNRVFLHD
ncbi:MAG: TatD family hydrolase [Gammaproteobacteria bacterium]|uniref:TatD family hydrolase n=1 Tax=Methylotuvimicrobium sp. TaxID=2822413 RepID=UPI001D71362B|nr:TatD family hydrolase [Gammaproteobacteria bacterium]